MESWHTGDLHDFDALMKCHHDKLLADLTWRLERAEERIIDRMAAAKFQIDKDTEGRSADAPADSEHSLECDGHPRISVGSRDTHTTLDATMIDKTTTTATFGQRVAGAITAIPTNIFHIPLGSGSRTARSKQLTRGQGASQCAFEDAELARKQRAFGKGGGRLTVDITECEQSRLQRLMSSSMTDAFFGFVILSNAIFIGVQTDYSARMLTNSTPDSFLIVNTCYSTIFSVELVLKLCAEGFGFFTRSESRHWNLLDFFVATTSVVETSIDIHVRFSDQASDKLQSISQFRMLRITRLTRLIRVVRITRLIRFIRALRTLVTQILFTVKSLIWAVLLLLLLNFLFATLFTQMVVEYLVQKGDGRPDWGAHSQPRGDPLLRYWSTLPHSMLTLYLVITGGVNWEDALLPLYDIGALSVFLLLVYICFSQLAVLNVITGVFCQNAIESANHDADLVTQQVLTDKKLLKKRIEQLFREINVSQSGALTLQECCCRLEDEEVRACFDALEIDAADVWTLFKVLDTEEVHEIDLDEFVSGCFRLKGTAKSLDLAALTYEHKVLMKRIGTFIQATEKSLQALEHAATADAPGTERRARTASSSMDGRAICRPLPAKLVEPEKLRQKPVAQSSYAVLPEEVPDLGVKAAESTAAAWRRLDVSSSRI